MEQPVCPRCHDTAFTMEPLKKICRNCGNEFYLSKASTRITDDLTGVVTYRDIRSPMLIRKRVKKDSQTGLVL